LVDQKTPKRSGEMKKCFSVLLVVLIAFCANVAESGEEQLSDSRVIAIATLMSHPALDAVRENLKEELKQQGFVEGKNIKYISRNANGQVQLAANIATELAAREPDVIVAITTPMAQAVAKVARCPVVFAAVTDPIGAGIVNSLNQNEGNITGTSDAWPYKDQLELIRQISPDAKRLAVLYNPGEAASQYGIKQIRLYAKELGFELLEGSVSSTGEVYPVAQNLSRRSDVLFLSSDNTVIAGVAAAVKVAVEHKKPLYVGDSGTVEKGGVAAVSVGYAKLGSETGKLVARFLHGERNIPVVVAQGDETYINKKAAAMMGVTIPERILAKATKVYEEIKE
ncbi:MAG: ABC transporter substrate-binding protein, partial [Candidatus Electrothrix sp. ATG2]|nr:ABC transporter substrate-binding protein [Candidatus Electrothrix sp. ATG2]